MTYMNREHLLALADRCESGAALLAYDAEHAAEVLAERAGGDQIDPQEWAQHKRDAAAAARQYALTLRAEAAGMADAQPVAEPRIREAEKVAAAAHLDGILIDGGRLSAAEADNLPGQGRGAYAPERQAIEDAQRAEDAAITGSGMFVHIAETINGIEQVPYWRLRGTTDQAQNLPEQAVTPTADDDADGM